MTPLERIARLRALSKAAQPAPWSFWPGYGISPRWGVSLSFDEEGKMEADTELVIESRNALDALLDVAEAAIGLRDVKSSLASYLRVDIACERLEAALDRFAAGGG